MAEALSLNQFAPNVPLAGMYVYLANSPQLHNVIVAATQETPLASGAIVTLDSTSTNTNAPVVKQAEVTSAIFGIVTYNPLKAAFQANERIAIAREGEVVWLPAAAAISVGAELYFNADNQVTSTPTAGNSIVGKALTKAAAAGDLVQVELGFKTTQAGD